MKSEQVPVSTGTTTQKDGSMVPVSLKRWFVVHFVADFIFAVPLLLAPVWFLGLFGWGEGQVDPFTARLVAAALFGIGGTSLLAREQPVASYVTMLGLKIIWSVTAVLGMVISLCQGAPQAGWLFVIIFSAFNFLWSFYFVRLRRQV